MNRIRRTVITAIIVLVVLALAVPSMVGVLTDWWWFQEIGYQVVFTTQIATRANLFLFVGLVTAGILYLNLRIAQRGVILNPVVVRVGPSTPQLDTSRVVRRLTTPAVIVIGLLAGLGASSLWDVTLMAMHPTRFGTVDPVFARDVGFYVFTLPAIAAALAFLFALALGTLLALLVIYALRSDIVVHGRGLRFDQRAGWHLGIVLAVLFLIAAAQLWIVDSANLLYSTTGPLVGASYTDLHATLPALRVSAVAAVARRRARAVRRDERTPGPLQPVRRGRLRRHRHPRPRALSGGDAEVHGGAHRADARDAVPALAHRRDPRRVGARQRRGQGPRQRDHAHARRPPGQHAHHRERAAVGARPAAPDLRPAAGDPHLLRLRLGGRRPLLDRREVPPDPALAARAEPGELADAHLHQRAPHLHPRHGPHPRPREPGHRRGAAGAVREGPAAHFERVAQRHAPADLLRRAGRRLRVRGHAAARVRLPLRRPGRVRALQGHRRRAGGERVAAADAGRAVRIVERVLLAGHHRRQPRALQPRDPGPRPEGPALPDASTATRTS